MNLSERERKREASFICYYVKSTLLQSFWWQPGCATAKCIPQTLMTILLSSFIPLCPFISRPSRGAIPHDYTLPTIQCVAHVSMTFLAVFLAHGERVTRHSSIAGGCPLFSRWRKGTGHSRNPGKMGGLHKTLTCALVEA